MSQIIPKKKDFSHLLTTEVDKVYLQRFSPLLKWTAAGLEGEVDRKNFKDQLIPDDTDLLLCLDAQFVWKAKFDLGGQLYDFFSLIEQMVGVKPQLVLTQVDAHSKYHQIFWLVWRLQRLGIRVWEHHSKHLDLGTVRHFFSENGIGNNDHIPVRKQYAMICDLLVWSGAFSVAMSQIFCDQELGITSTFVLLEENEENTSDFSSLLAWESTLVKKIKKFLIPAHPLHSRAKMEELLLWLYHKK